MHSNMAMVMLLRRMGRTVTTHGMRSTFRDWAGDATEFPRDLIEQAGPYDQRQGRAGLSTGDGHRTQVDCHAAMG